ncbi:hypothetical protein G6F59_014611 [Rhizopus arrhizus]|nr:hypothetical protein G6F59_014611 [Rhizopus arrhizus]
MTPLQLPDGGTVLVNRGFVLPEWRKNQAAATQPPAEGSVTGLLRMGEPGSGFLRNNDPAANLWYSRDLPAIAAARGLTAVAPYFLAAEAAASPGRDPAKAPVGGLTVLSFPTNHLGYAITWYALALMIIVAPSGAFFSNRVVQWPRGGITPSGQPFNAPPTRCYPAPGTPTNLAAVPGSGPGFAPPAGCRRETPAPMRRPRLARVSAGHAAHTPWPFHRPAAGPWPSASRPKRSPGPSPAPGVRR